MHSPFTNLPLEIFEQIINILEPTELLVLAKTCRQFNALSIRQFFLLHKVDNPSKLFQGTLELSFLPREEDSVGLELTHKDPTTFNDAGGNTFEGLAVAFDIMTIEHLHCIIHHSTPDPYPLTRYLNVLRRVIWAVRRLQHIGRVTLKLEMGGYLLITHEDERSIIRQWKEVMGTLLNLLVEKGCENLEVSHGTFPLRPLQDMFILNVDPLPGRQNILQRTKSLFTRKSKPISPTMKDTDAIGTPTVDRQAVRFFRDSLDLIHLSKSARDSSRLRHLEISSRVLLHPPCSHWTYSILQTSNLTSLSLYMIYEASLTHMLSWLLLPIRSQLRELSIELCSRLPSAAPLIDLIVGLRALTHLKLADPVPEVYGHKLPITSKVFPRSKNAPVLPNLVSLHAFSDWIQLLCLGSSPRPTVTSLSLAEVTDHTTSTYPCSQSQPPSRPNLQYLYIMPRTFREFHFDLSFNVLQPILESSAFPFALSNFRVALDLRRYSVTHHMSRDAIRWGGADPRDFKSTTPVITSGSSAGAPPRLRPTRPPRKRAQRPSGYELYDRITELVVYDSGFFQQHQSKIFCQFFSMWEGVKRVEFRASRWKDEDVKVLIKEARVCSRNIREFVLREKVYAVDDFEGDGRVDEEQI
ncbi:hypothetical protein BDN72DRAFT_833525 [Pluteus cervinus]|uniref:Uncharacterized protein n=1 Tax=Pluteus cervinus TaxID=181527 RepID=A0ACD3B859_9AGAR|nr:hypothetical protein BDN72DRAFT_833525 [Pluteus cervinus]